MVQAADFVFSAQYAYIANCVSGLRFRLSELLNLENTPSLS